MKPLSQVNLRYMRNFSGIFRKYSGLEEKVFDPTSKSEWLERVRYYHAAYYSGNDGFYPGGVGKSGRSFKEIRDYARGIQDITKYKDVLDPVQKQGGRAIRRWNISWDPINVLPRYRRQVVSKMAGINIDVQFSLDDSTVKEQKILTLNKIKFMQDKRTADMLMRIGIPPSSNDYPEVEDVDDIKVDVEVMLQDAVKDALNSDIWEDLRTKMVEDLVDIGVCACEPYFCRQERIIKFKYIDPAWLAVRPSNYSDYRDSDHWGYVEWRNPFSVAVEAGVQVNELVRGGAYLDGERIGYTAINSPDNSVEVFNVYFIALVEKTFVTGQYKTGNRMYYEISGKPRSGVQIEVVRMPMLFKASWVVGSDVIFNYGLADVIAREYGRIVPPIAITSLEDKSFVEQCIPLVDDMNIAIYRLRNILANMPPPPKAIIDKSVLNDIVRVGDYDYTIKDALRLFKSTGVLVVESKSEYGFAGEFDVSKRRPIEPLPIDYSNDIMICLREVERAMDGIRKVSGFNEITDGIAAAPDMLKHVAAGLNTATNSAMMPWIDKWVNCVRTIAGISAKKYLYELVSSEGGLVSKDIKKNVLDLLDTGIRPIVYVDKGGMKDFLIQILVERRGEILPQDIGRILMLIERGEYKKAELELQSAYEKAISIQHAMSKDLVITQQRAAMEARAGADMASAGAEFLKRAAINE